MVVIGFFFLDVLGQTLELLARGHHAVILKLVVFILLEELGESGLLEGLRRHVVSGERQSVGRSANETEYVGKTRV